MADTDKTAPARVKAARGESASGPYARRASKDYGRRTEEWRVRAKTGAGRARAAARVALRRGDEPEPYRPRHDAGWWAY